VSESARPLVGYDAGRRGWYGTTSGSNVFAACVAPTGVYPPACCSECAKVTVDRSSHCASSINQQ
jgi:hypothetical protein